MVEKSLIRKKEILFLLLIVIGGVALFFTSHNERFYQRPVAEVTHEKTTSQRKTKDQFENVDHQYNQKLTVKMLNGRYRDQQLVVQNTYSDSQPMDQKYRVGNKIF